MSTTASDESKKRHTKQTLLRVLIACSGMFSLLVAAAWIDARNQFTVVIRDRWSPTTDSERWTSSTFLLRTWSEGVGFERYRHHYNMANEEIEGYLSQMPSLEAFDHLKWKRRSTTSWAGYPRYTISRLIPSRAADRMVFVSYQWVLQDAWMELEETRSVFCLRWWAIVSISSLPWTIHAIPRLMRWTAAFPRLSRNLTRRYLRYRNRVLGKPLPASRCPRCEYDRTGLDPLAPCPECGYQPKKPVPNDPAKD